MGADVMQKETRSLQTLIVCNVDQLEVNASHGGQLDASNDDMRSSGSHAHSKPFRNGCTFIFSDQPKLVLVHILFIQLYGVSVAAACGILPMGVITKPLRTTVQNGSM